MKADWETRVARAVDDLLVTQAKSPIESKFRTVTGFLMFSRDRVYKALRPVTTAVCDQATISKRRTIASTAFDLNSRLSPDVYLAIHLLHHGQCKEPILEMRRLCDGAFLDRRIPDATVVQQVVATVPAAIARFHAQARTAAHTSGSGIRLVLSTLRRLPPSLINEASVKTRTAAVIGYCRELHRQWRRRPERYATRDCHGDLTFSNIAIEHGRCRLLDRIDYRADFRLIDPVEDIAAYLADCLLFLKDPTLAQRAWIHYRDLMSGVEGFRYSAPRLQLLVIYRLMVGVAIAREKALHFDETPDDRSNARSLYELVTRRVLEDGTRLLS